MAKRRSWKDERERSTERGLARLDPATRAGVLEALQGSAGNNALQRAVGPQLQRDTATVDKPAKPLTHPSAAGKLALSIGGKVAGCVRIFSGGGVRSQVVETAGPGGQIEKHVSVMEYEPVVLEVGLGLGAGFFDLLRNAFDYKYSRVPIALHYLDSSGQERSRLELAEPLLTKLELPELSASTTSPAWLRLTVEAESIKSIAASGAKVDAKAPDPLDPSTVEVEVDKIGRLSNVTSVGRWSFETPAVKDQIGTHQLPSLRPGAPKIGNIKLALSETGKGATSEVAALDEWVQAVLKGDTTDERTITLSVSSKGGRKLKLEFLRAGIARADLISLAEGRRRQYEFYADRVRLASA